MKLEDQFAHILNSLPDLLPAELAEIAAAISAAKVDTRGSAERLKTGTLPAEIEAEFLAVLPFNAARLAMAQAIDKACERPVSSFDSKGGAPAGGWLNDNHSEGLVISAAGTDGTLEGDVDDHVDNIQGFFDNLLHIPPRVWSAHPDMDGLPSERVGLRYIRYSLADYLGFDADQPVNIGYIPLGETESDLEFDIRQRGGRACYSAQPVLAAERLVQALECLVKEGAQLVVVPETALGETELPQVREALGLFAKEPGSRLIAIVVGLAARPGSDGQRARNEVVVLGRHGEEIARQPKLTHWNLSPGQQQRYGLGGHSEPGEYLWEDTDAGDVLTIVELPHLGRMVIHICADLQATEPANWVRRNMKLDWSVTPLMDSTLTFDLGKWVFRRALEAARAGRTQAVVAASLVLTQRQNRVNRASGDIGRWTNLCGLFLLLDGRFGEVQGMLVAELLSAATRGRPVANLVQHPGDRPLVTSCVPDRSGQYASRGCMVLEGENLHLIASARLVSRSADYSPNMPTTAPCELVYGGSPDTLHLVYDPPPGSHLDAAWDFHLIGRPITLHGGQTITTFNSVPLPR